MTGTRPLIVTCRGVNTPNIKSGNAGLECETKICIGQKRQLKNSQTNGNPDKVDQCKFLSICVFDSLDPLLWHVPVNFLGHKSPAGRPACGGALSGEAEAHCRRERAPESLPPRSPSTTPISCQLTRHHNTLHTNFHALSRKTKKVVTQNRVCKTTPIMHVYHSAGVLRSLGVTSGLVSCTFPVTSPRSSQVHFLVSTQQRGL